ncbi:ROK family transcriptional regulator [Paenibacillus qinlingensis]|uniref:NBD/HSP70 family sugar kinase n=1 Tax=Paenibacillus qinlingensis TaxID=1837343 RepID=A0ABU1NVX0_9BACL|nr:ROK family transcriptional regulator [Paenibacillus qinlingensis]MDR6551621.1 putative NBD/HSP70 family sugar kinase [Paenibacillus qinlingensis]
MKTEQGNSFLWMKMNNQSKVLKLLHRERLISRIEISRKSGIQKQTVTNIIGDLLHQGLVVEEETLSLRGAGRRPTQLRLNRERLVSIGVEVTKSHVAGVLMDYNRMLLHQEKMSLSLTPIRDTNSVQAQDAAEQLLNMLIQIIEMLLAKVPEASIFTGIGVGVQGIVNSHEGIVIHSPYLGWFQVPVRSLLEDRFSIPVFIDNNVRAFAIGEVWSRPEEDLGHVLCVYLDEGVGSAIVINHEIYSGYQYQAGEIGHVKIELNGELCYCGQRGCLEPYVSVQNLGKKMGLDGGFGEIVTLLKKQDTRAVKELQDVGDRLGFVLGNTINLMNPQAVILGGELIRAVSWFAPSMTIAMEQTTRASNRSTAIIFSDFHQNNGSIGAASLVFHQGLLNTISGKEGSGS